MDIIRKRTVDSLPKQLYIEPTNRCNSKCNICVRTFNRNEQAKDLSFEEFKFLVDQFPGLERAVLHGIGEPLLNKDILKMVEHLKGKGVYVLFNSNATLLDSNTKKGLIKAGLDEFRVSIDSANPETYLKLRGISEFDSVIENVRKFIVLKTQLNKKSPRISFWFVGTRENLGELPSLLKLADKVGVKEVYLQRLTFFEQPKAFGIAREDQAIYQVPDPAIIEIIKESQEIARKLDIQFFSSGASTPTESLINRISVEHPWQKCYRPWTLSYISANGNVLPCCISPFSTNEYTKLIIGNAFEEKFEDIWNNNKYVDIRKSLLSSNPHNYCRGCGQKWSL
jgi:MoaA/NifB/PqqE/SkfB family radical SAM enzyme